MEKNILNELRLESEKERAEAMESMLNIYEWSYGDIPIEVLKNWVEKQIANRKKKVEFVRSSNTFSDEKL